MEIKIKKLTLLNFKGVRNLEITFGDVTNIQGDNATGKTSIMDAFLWCLFGKNSEDAKDFNIKTLDRNNQPIHKLSHEVTAVLSVDGRTMSFKRTYKEKWVTKKGEAVEEFSGHETTYTVDDIPMTQKEFQGRIDVIFNESIAKMITSPTYFNQLKWQDRRTVLEAMAGAISNSDIAGSNYEFHNLLTAIGNEKFVDFKKKLAAKKLKIKEQQSSLPARIDEAERSKPAPQNYEIIALHIRDKKIAIESVEDQIENKAKAYEAEFEKINQANAALVEKKTKLAELKANSGLSKRNKIGELESAITGFERELASEHQAVESNNRTIAGNQTRIDSLIKRNDVIRAEWTKENSKTLVLDDHATTCPTCKQNLPQEEIEATRKRLTENFNSNKKVALDKLNVEGVGNKEIIESLTKDNESLKIINEELHAGKIKALETKIAAYKEDIEIVKAWPEATSPEIELLQKEVNEFTIPAPPVIDNASLKAEKNLLVEDLHSLQQLLNGKEQTEKLNARIKELSDEQGKLSQELANLEKMEFTMAEFNKARIETIEARINGKFSLVKFKMFEQQINGGETECCECMVNGVPYSDVNTAGKIQAGIDIINALTEHYNVNAPVFIDNRESIIRIPECRSQIINLRAVKNEPLSWTSENKLAASAN